MYTEGRGVKGPSCVLICGSFIYACIGVHVSCHFVSFRLVSFRFAFTFAFTLTAGVRCILLCALKASSYLLLPFALANAHFIEINSVLTSSQHRSAAFWPWHRLLPRHLPRVLWLLLADFMALRGGVRCGGYGYGCGCGCSR